MRLLLSLGGTGGHIHAAEEFIRRADCEILLAGHGLATNRYLSSDLPRFEICSGRRPGKLCKGLIQSLRLLRRTRPDAVVGFGSYHAAPMLMAARLLGVPYFLHDSNVHPGKVTRFFARKARATAVHFPVTSVRGRTLLIEPLTRVPSVSRQEAARYYGLDPALQTLLVFGGSQGAEAINCALAECDLTGWQLLHFTTSGASSPGKVIKPFEERMEMAWAIADLAVTRAGALTLTEAMRFGVPSILIPWPGAAEDHQRLNAEYLAKIGGALLLSQEELTGERLQQTIASVDLEKRRAMRANLCAVAKLPRSDFFEWIKHDLSSHRHRRHRDERACADSLAAKDAHLGERLSR